MADPPSACSTAISGLEARDEPVRGWASFDVLPFKSKQASPCYARSLYHLQSLSGVNKGSIVLIGHTRSPPYCLDLTNEEHRSFHTLPSLGSQYTHLCLGRKQQMHTHTPPNTPSPHSATHTRSLTVNLVDLGVLRQNLVGQFLRGGQHFSVVD